MSSTAPPTIPPRPVKAQAAAQGVSNLPEMPPRPTSKRLERSVSPGHYPRSPLNEPYILTKTKTLEAMRAPSVDHLPTPGEEGLEYANVQYAPKVSSALAQDANTQTRLVAEDLHLHAPKPSLPKSSATAQVQGVTRTDSAQAASHGLGRASQEDLTLNRTRSRQSFSRPDSAASGDRRRSTYLEDHGPAEMGLRVPINPLLGDVQAPTPQGMSPQPTGDGRHGRKKSSANDVRPPDVYGLHGHGTIANSQFEREWYAKHPEQLEHEEGHGHGVYEGIGSGRGNLALSSDQLNKIVRETASRGSGFGTNENIMSYPDEQIGYNASEVYQRSQQNTPHPDGLSRMQTHESQPAIQSPLRRTSFPAEDASPADVRKSSRLSQDLTSNDAFHVDEPKRKFNKLTGGQESLTETQETKPYLARDDDDGHEYRVPILAEDEVAKSTGGEWLHPAVSPKFERRSSQQYDDHHDSGTHTPTSRPASRPGSIYQLHSASHSLSRFLSHQDERDHLHTPLADVAEYEPLFDDNDEKKALSAAERFKKRPDSLSRRFPSQDIWEDTPSSAMYVAEVSTPDLPYQDNDESRDKSELGITSTFEPPEAEAARKGEIPDEDKLKMSPEERLAKSKWAPHLRDDMPTKSRPALLATRFPSQDVWEDTPDSNYLTTTVSSAQQEEETSPIETKPPVPARPSKNRLGEGASPAQIEPSVVPQIPDRRPQRTHQVPPSGAQLTDAQTLSREVSPTELKKTPSLPDRPKPQIPPRPGRKPGDGSAEIAEDTVRSKPQVPARPAGNIAALKGNFLSDLNKKLGMGPPKEKEPEPEVEAKPLEDARKGRARGPQRRAPAKSPAADARIMPSFSMFSARSLWQIDESDELNTVVEDSKKTEPIAAVDHVESTKTERPLVKTSADGSADGSATADDEDLEGEMTRKTTASTNSGAPIDREESPEQAHVLAASRQTTASDQENVKEPLEKTISREPEVKAEEEPIKVRNEQTHAPAPDTSDTHTLTGNKPTIVNSAEPVAQRTAGDDKPQEPMTEEDVSYGKLEEMTAMADGKVHAQEEPDDRSSSRKVAD